MAGVPDWLRLQKLIFARYVQQKLREVDKKREVKDVVKEMADGIMLIELIEVMSGKKMEKKPAPTTVRIKMVNNVNESLKFARSVGIDVDKIRVSAEDMVDGNEKVILALIFGIISKYMKFEDDDEKADNMDIRDALSLWLRNKTDGYPHVSIEVKGGKLDPKQFHNGCWALALVHKMRPKLIDYSFVNPASGPANLKEALELGSKYLNIDKYLSPEDILKLDELSMIVYLSDWYNGVFLLMKQDIAARRIGKLVNITELHDKMRAEYTAQGTAIRAWVDQTIANLNKREFDDTLAGIRALLEKFYAYKAGEKGKWVGEKLDSAALFNNLALRLANNRRPAWVPPNGTAPKEIEAKFVELEEVETKRSVDLNKELSRQLRLHKLHKRFLANAEKFVAWVGEKKAYLAKQEPIDNVEPAEDALEALGLYNKEYAHVISSQLQDLQAIGAEFEKERFEHRGAVQAQLQGFKGDCDALVAGAAAKKARLDAELEKQKAINDKLCLAFATGAKDFLAWLAKKSHALSDGGGKPLEDQLAEVQAASSDSKDADSKLAVLAEQERAVQARNIDVNPHTGVSLGDLKAQWTQFLSLLAKKKELLADQIEEAKRGGLSPEQMEEIHQNFLYFDKDKSGVLNKRELKACLSSLGEESTPAAVGAMLTEYDKDKSGTLHEEEFAAYMKKQMGDSGQQEQIVTAFKYLCYDKDHVLEAELVNVVNGKTFKDHHVDYLKQNVPKKGAGYDYATWTAAAFAR